MEPRFEQFKKLETEIEMTPMVKPEVHFELNDISKKMLQGGELSQEDIDFLDSLYTSLQSLEINLTDYLDDYRASEIISKEEFLVAANHFLVAKQNGPDSGLAVSLLTERRISPQGFEDAIKDISIPEHTKAVLMNVYRKIY
ncbi:MAG: hypothetical protein ABIO57_01600 [Candidatus Paceibacterota bacterium]